MTDKLDAATRQAASQLVRWCPEGEMWEPDDYPTEPRRQTCSGCDPVHYLRRRRMLICSECKQAEFTKEGFESHECFSAY